jgi:hypothetical protein
MVRFSSLDTRKQINPPFQYVRLDGYTCDVLQPEIYEKYEPTVKRRF